MAGASLLLLLDDIATVLDDVALMTKIAAKKTAGVLGDDLALNAQQVSGVRAERELPVVWAVAKGSLINKAILVPAALLISAVAPWLITPLLMVGGSYLCFEGAEKLWHVLHKKKTHQTEQAPKETEITDLAAYEKQKIKGAVRTDFVLSAEIIVIALGTVPPESAFAVRAGVLIVIGLVMTAGVYGLVGGIVKLDDAGFWLLKKNGGKGLPGKLGSLLVSAAPYLMRLLGVVGTAAMFLVGGGILAHGLPFFHHIYDFTAGWPIAVFWPQLINALGGIVAGGLVVLMVEGLKKLKSRPQNQAD